MMVSMSKDKLCSQGLVWLGARKQVREQQESSCQGSRKWPRIIIGPLSYQ